MNLSFYSFMLSFFTIAHRHLVGKNYTKEINNRGGKIEVRPILQENAKEDQKICIAYPRPLARS